MKIAINAQIDPSIGNGGVLTVLAGLIKALSRLKGEEVYVIVGTSENSKWLQQYMGKNQELVIKPAYKKPEMPTVQRSVFRRILAPVARPLLDKIRLELLPPPLPPPPQSVWPEVPVSDGYWESLGCDVIHFPYQSHVVCGIPTVFNPHDLQHLHYPQYFSPQDIASRDTLYYSGCHFSNTIAVASEWVKQDITKQYAIHPDKIQVIPWAPPTQVIEAPIKEEIASVKEKYYLDRPFALFPAMTWEHKNHMRLIEAYREACDETGMNLQIVCTGKQHDPHWSRIKNMLAKEGLNEDVKFVGLVPEKDLRCIYNLALFVIVPTLFEAASGPVFEAWNEGIPVSCSTVTSLPEQVGDAALLFNPYSVDDIKNALIRMTNEPALREELSRKGERRLQDFSWEQTAKAYRAVYRRAAGRDLTKEDHRLLKWDWMKYSSVQST